MKIFRDKRAELKEKAIKFTGIFTQDAYDSLCCEGYTKISDNPEVQMCVNKIADLVSSMTIKLMENAENGNKRVRDELSKKIDIHPNNLMTRKNFVFHIVKTLLLHGDGNCICFPKYITKNGKVLLDNIDFFDMSKVTYNKSYTSYSVNYNGLVYENDEILHFVLMPSARCPFVGKGYSHIIMDTINNLKQATKTKNGFMSSKFQPSLIIKVDSNTDTLSSKEGREKILESYMQNDPGKPWLVPAEQFEVNTIKPLTLNDLAINDSVKLDKETVAKIFDVPGFLVGTGEKFDKEEYNNFIDTRIMGIAQNIQQELTLKLLYSESRFFEFNSRSIYAYNLKDLADVSGSFRDKGIMAGNEARNWVGLDPKDGLDELVILENYIPTVKVGKQKKLLVEGEGGDEEDETNG